MEVSSLISHQINLLNESKWVTPFNYTKTNGRRAGLARGGGTIARAQKQRASSQRSRARDEL